MLVSGIYVIENKLMPIKLFGILCEKTLVVNPIIARLMKREKVFERLILKLKIKEILKIDLYGPFMPMAISSGYNEKQFNYMTRRFM